jgi:hypothetical protein
MQRAAAVLPKLKAKNLPLEDLARAAWRKAVGGRLDRKTRAVGLVRRTLVVEVEDATWQRQLTAIRPHILKNLEDLLGGGQVSEIEFRIGIPRMPPQREEESAPAAGLAGSADESDRIADPVFRRLYRQGRKRSAG